MRTTSSRERRTIPMLPIPAGHTRALLRPSTLIARSEALRYAM